MALFPERKKKLKEADNLGFGTRITGQGTRILNADGTFNVKTIGGRGNSLYQDLVEMTWGRFFLLVAVVFTLVNAIFAIMFLLTGMECLSGTQGSGILENFAEAWFFSVQTLTTVGYGAVSPVCFSSNLIASFIALTGLVTFALITGLFFARFSKPVAQFRFSEHAIIGPYRPDMDGLMFRMANRRDNRVINVEAKLVMSWVEHQPGGEERRRFSQLELEIDRVAMLALSWTIVHPITEDSPLFKKGKKELDEMQVEIFTLISAHDDSFAQEVHGNRSYSAEEIKCGFKFLRMYYPGDNGKTILDMRKINEMEAAELMANGG